MFYNNPYVINFIKKHTEILRKRNKENIHKNSGESHYLIKGRNNDEDYSAEEDFDEKIDTEFEDIAEKFIPNYDFNYSKILFEDIGSFLKNQILKSKFYKIN